MNVQAVAERIYQRTFASEASRQERIAATAKHIEQHIAQHLLTDDTDALEVAADMLGWMEAETMMKLIRHAAQGSLEDAAAMRTIVLRELGEQIKRTAEDRAIKHVEPMTAEDFLPD